MGHPPIGPGIEATYYKLTRIFATDQAGAIAPQPWLAAAEREPAARCITTHNMMNTTAWIGVRIG